MKNGMKNLIITMALIVGTFGISNAQEAEVAPATEISGDFSTDITIGDATSFNSPYTGLSISGDGWVLSTNLSDGNVSIEEAKYSWSVSDAITLTLGSQAEPYGLAWGLHRPSNNSFVSIPRDHVVSNGVSVSTSALGIGVNAFYGGDITNDMDEAEAYWAARVSYGVSLFGINSNVGISVNSNDAQLIDVSESGTLLGLPYKASFEYDLAAKDVDGESSPTYWFRSVVTPEFAKGASVLIGYNSDDEVLYGVEYKCSSTFKLSTELSGDGDTVLRGSYSF
tara:strand:- start:1371 stop:2213 length:843 start_codon:yes stop_codon:yes gene_type:complete